TGVQTCALPIYIGASQFALGNVGELAQHQVAYLVAMHVVDILEVVQVNQGDMQACAATFGARQLFIKTGQEMAPVEQAGQLITHGNFLEACHRLVQLCVGIGKALLVVAQCLALFANALLQIVDITTHIHEPRKAERKNHPQANADAENLRLWLRDPLVDDEGCVADQDKQRHGKHAQAIQRKNTKGHYHEVDRLHRTANVAGVMENYGYGEGGEHHLRDGQARVPEAS